MNARALQRSLRAIVAACAVAATCGAAAGDQASSNITLKTAWLRPAAVGMAEAQAYVDIISATDLVLVGASTPFAKKVELVEVTMKDDKPEAKVVASMPVPGGKTTRLAYRGSHLRLVDITRDFGNGTPVPLTLEFKSPDGKEVTASVNATVRGVLLPQQMNAVAPTAAEPAANDAAPAAAK
jgi:copper(I)-binding protein